MNILIVAPAWVGDMVMAHTLVQLLEASRPGCSIHMVAPPATAALATRMPGVREVHTLAVGHGELGLTARWRLARQLPRFDEAIVLPNTLKSALVPLFAGVPRRTGWLGESRWGVLNDVRRLDKQALPAMIERFMALALPPGEALSHPYPRPVLRADAEAANRLAGRLSLNVRGEAAVICPGAEFGPAKQWPEAHYAEVARHLAKQGRQVWLMGSPKDRPVCDAIAGLAGHPEVRSVAGETSLLEAVDLMSMARVAISNDSGLMHVAAALGVRVVAIYGSTSPDFTPPLHDDAVIVRLGLDCSPCFERHCPLGHLACLRDLEPARVIACL